MPRPVALLLQFFSISSIDGKLAFQFFRCHVGSAQIFEVVESCSQSLIVVVTHIEYVDQLEEIVGDILLIKYRNVGFRCQSGSYLS